MFGFLQKNTKDELPSPERFVFLLKDVVERYGRESSNCFVTSLKIKGFEYEIAFSSEGIHSVSSKDLQLQIRDIHFLMSPGMEDLEEIPEVLYQAEDFNRFQNVEKRILNYSISIFMRFMDNYDSIETVDGAPFNGRVDRPRVVASLPNLPVISPYDLISRSSEEARSLVLMSQTLGVPRFREPCLYIKDSFAPETYCEWYLEEDFGDESGFPVNASYTPFHMVGILWHELYRDILGMIESDEAYILDAFYETPEDLEEEETATFTLDDEDGYDPLDFTLQDEDFSVDALQVREEDTYTKYLDEEIKIDGVEDLNILKLVENNKKLEDEVKRTEAALKIEMKKYAETVSPILRKKYINVTSFDEDLELENFSEEDYKYADSIYQSIHRIENSRMELNNKRRILLSRLSLENLSSETIDLIYKKIDGVDSVENMTIYVPTEQEIEDERIWLNKFIEGNLESKGDILPEDETEKKSEGDEILRNHILKLRGNSKEVLLDE